MNMLCVPQVTEFNSSTHRESATEEKEKKQEKFKQKQIAGEKARSNKRAKTARTRASAKMYQAHCLEMVIVLCSFVHLFICLSVGP